MGAFNTLVLKQACPACGRKIELRIQFKYGDTWQYEYSLGDLVRWGGNDIGRPGQKHVVVDGVAEDCPACDHELPDYEVHIENDCIARVVPQAGRYDFAAGGDSSCSMSNADGRG